MSIENITQTFQRIKPKKANKYKKKQLSFASFSNGALMIEFAWEFRADK